jgi:hypothetical protein
MQLNSTIYNHRENLLALEAAECPWGYEIKVDRPIKTIPAFIDHC